MSLNKLQEFRFKQLAKEKGVKVTRWSGMLQFNCPFCKWDTLNWDDMLRHLKRYEPPPEPKKVSRVVKDVHGNPIEY